MCLGFFLGWQPCAAAFGYAFLDMSFCTLLKLTVISISILFDLVSHQALFTVLCLQAWVSLETAFRCAEVLIIHSLISVPLAQDMESLSLTV